MKTLILMRHGEVQYDHRLNPNGTLCITKKGMAQVFDLAQKLKEKEPNIDRIFHSPSIRTTETMLVLDSIYQMSKADIETAEWLQEEGEVLKNIASINNNLDCICFVTHQPTLLNFVQSICTAEFYSLFRKTIIEEPMITCRTATILKFDTDKWVDISPKAMIAALPVKGEYSHNKLIEAEEVLRDSCITLMAYAKSLEDLDF